MDIDRIGTLDFSPGWISRAAMPWDEQIRLVTARSLSPISVSSPDPLGTLPEWQGIAVPGFVDAEQPPEPFRRLRRWMAVGIPAPRVASQDASKPDWLQYAYRIRPQGRRQITNGRGVESQQENSSSEQELAETANPLFDLVLSSPQMSENETELSDSASPFTSANAFASMLDFVSSEHSQSNNALHNLGIAPVHLPVAVPSRAFEIGEANALPFERETTLGSDVGTSGELAPLYRATDLRLPRAPNQIPLTLSRNLEQVLRREATQSPASAVQAAQIQALNLVPAQITRTVADERTLASTLYGSLGHIPTLGGAQTERERNPEGAVQAAEEYRQGISAEFETLRPTLAERSSQVQNLQTDEERSNIILSNSTTGEQGSHVRGLDQSIFSRFRQDRSEATTSIPLASPAFTLLQPLRNAVSLNTRVPTQASPALSLSAAPLALAQSEQLATSIESIAETLPGLIFSERGVTVRSPSEAPGAPAFNGNVRRALPADRVLAPPQANDWIQDLDRVNQPAAVATPQTTFAGAPTPPAMQVRRAISETASVDRTSNSMHTAAVAEELQAVPFSSSTTKADSTAADHAALGSSIAAGSQAASAIVQSPQPPDINALARQVYAILKDRLRAERERHEIYGR